MSSDQMNAIVQSLEQKMEKLLGQITTVRAENQKLKSDLATIRTENDRLSKDLAALKLTQQSQASDVRDRLSNLTALLDRLDSELT